MFLFLSTGLATLRYGDAFLLERIRSLQLHEGWPGHELPSRGFGRAVGIAFGVALLGLDFLVLIGSIAGRGPEVRAHHCGGLPNRVHDCPDLDWSVTPLDS